LAFADGVAGGPPPVDGGLIGESAFMGEVHLVEILNFGNTAVANFIFD
jgi:hypothetical protein